MYEEGKDVNGKREGRFGDFVIFDDIDYLNDNLIAKGGGTKKSMPETKRVAQNTYSIKFSAL